MLCVFGECGCVFSGEVVLRKLCTKDFAEK